MKKSEFISSVDKLIELHQKLSDEMHKVTKEAKDSPRILNCLAYQDEDILRHISSLAELKKDAEAYDGEIKVVNRMFNMPEECMPECGKGFSFEDEEEK